MNNLNFLTALFFFFVQYSIASPETFRWTSSSKVTSLDPHNTSDFFTREFQNNLYEGLTYRNERFEIVGALAESWELVEPNKWRFNLRKNVFFHSGDQFTAHDVLFSIERAKQAPNRRQRVIESISSLDIVDEFTIDINTESPNPILPTQLAALYIISAPWTARNSSDEEARKLYDKRSNGTGPFQILEFQTASVTLLRNDKYWGEIESNLDKIEFYSAPQPVVGMAALISGDTDLLDRIPFQDRRRIDLAEGVNLLTTPEPRTIFLGFDQLRDELLYSDVKNSNPFKDSRVRRAFMHAIDVDAITEQVMQGAASPTGSMVAEPVFGYSSAVASNRLSYEPTKAKALMAEAGYPDGFSIDLDCPRQRYVNDEQVCQAVSAMLSRIGVHVRIRTTNSRSYFKNIYAGGYYDTSFYLLGWTPSDLDSAEFISDVLSCRSSGKGVFNIGGYCNEEVSFLSSRIEREINPSARLAMMSEVFQIHSDEVGHIPLYQQMSSWGVRDGISVNQVPGASVKLRYVVADFSTVSNGGEILASRMFAHPDRYPPSDFAAYGIVAFPEGAATADRPRYIMFCEAFLTTLLSYKEVSKSVALLNQMVTVWPVTEGSDVERFNNVANDLSACGDLVDKYHVKTSQEAIIDAKRAGMNIGGRGPFLIAWAPASEKGHEDTIVLIADFSDVTFVEDAKTAFRFWVEDIEKDEKLWGEGFSTERILFKIKIWADRHGTEMLSFFGGD